MGKQNPFQLDVVSVRLVRDAPIFSAGTAIRIPAIPTKPM